MRRSAEGFRADPENLDRQLAGFVSNVHPRDWHRTLANPGFEPSRDCALFVSSWRNLSTDKVDFGSGKAKVFLGDEMPVQVRLGYIVDGANGDGVLCRVRFPGTGFEVLQNSGLLSCVAPEASFVSCLH